MLTSFGVKEVVNTENTTTFTHTFIFFHINFHFLSFTRSLSDTKNERMIHLPQRIATRGRVSPHRSPLHTAISGLTHFHLSSTCYSTSTLYHVRRGYCASLIFRSINYAIPVLSCFFSSVCVFSLFFFLLITLFFFFFTFSLRQMKVIVFFFIFFSFSETPE